MISPEDLTRVKGLTEHFWTATVDTEAFRGLFSGKEIGHRIADFVDEQTTAMLDDNFPTAHELGADNLARPRSMGDVWLLSGGIYNPINVKAGEAGKNGQPNLVSLTKLLSGLLQRKIDSYYLLIVKMRPERHAASDEVDNEDLMRQRIVPNVYLVDMLDCLDFVAFDAGPGQAMLREKKFYDAVDSGWAPEEFPMSVKVQRVYDLMLDGDRRLIDNRQRKMQQIGEAVEEYRSGANHEVNQNGLILG